MAKVLIAGCGYVGSLLAENLVAAGHQVVGLCRTANERPTIEGLEWFPADLTQAETLAELPKDLSHVVYAAAPGGGGDPDRYDKIYHRGLVSLCECLESARIQRFVFVSSTGVFGQMDGELVDEESEASATSASAQALLSAEHYLGESSLNAVVVRLSGIYGPQRIRMIRTVAEQLPVKANLLDRFLNHIHQADCAGVIQHLLFLEKVQGLYLASDGEAATRREMLGWLVDQLGQPFPPVSESTEAPLRGGTHKQVSNALLRASGYDFIYPSFREGYATLLEDYSNE